MTAQGGVGRREAQTQILGRPRVDLALRCRGAKACPRPPRDHTWRFAYVSSLGRAWLSTRLRRSGRGWALAGGEGTYRDRRVQRPGCWKQPGVPTKKKKKNLRGWGEARRRAVTCVVHSGTSGEAVPCPGVCQDQGGPRACPRRRAGRGCQRIPEAFTSSSSLPYLTCGPRCSGARGWERGNACI